MVVMSLRAPLRAKCRSNGSTSANEAVFCRLILPAKWLVGGALLVVRHSSSVRLRHRFGRNRYFGDEHHVQLVIVDPSRCAHHCAAYCMSVPTHQRNGVAVSVASVVWRSALRRTHVGTAGANRLKGGSSPHATFTCMQRHYLFVSC